MNNSKRLLGKDEIDPNKGASVDGGRRLLAWLPDHTPVPTTQRVGAECEIFPHGAV